VGRDSLNAARRLGASALPARGYSVSSGWVLFGLVVLGAFLRFYRIDAQSLWIDELFTIGAAEIGGHLGPREFFGNVQGPLHALIVNLVARISDSEFALRSISAFFGVGLIPVAYALGKSIVDRRTGLVAALLVCVSPFAIWYSQELRNYALLMFLSGLATLFAWRVSARAGRSWAPYVVAATLSIYSNLSGAFLAISHALFTAIRSAATGRGFRRAMIAFGVVALLAVPLAYGLFRWANRPEVAENVRFAPEAEAHEVTRAETAFSPVVVPYSVFSMGYGFSLGPSVRELHGGDPMGAVFDEIAVVGPASLVLLAAILLGLRRLADRRGGLSLALLVFLVPLACTFALALLNLKPVNPRYLAVAFPMLTVTMAAGVVSLKRPVAVLLCGLLVLFCGLSLWGHYFDTRYWKEDIRSAAYYVGANEQPGDIVLVPVVRDVFNHYYGGCAERFVFYRGQAESREAVRSRIEHHVGRATRLWYVAAREWKCDPAGRIRDFLGESYSGVDAARFTGVWVGLYELPGALGDEKGAGELQAPGAGASLDTAEGGPGGVADR